MALAVKTGSKLLHMMQDSGIGGNGSGSSPSGHASGTPMSALASTLQLARGSVDALKCLTYLVQLLVLANHHRMLCEAPQRSTPGRAS
jgi:hypothetical protein